MSRDLNRCEFIGNLGNDVEMRYLPNGTAVANLSIAVGDDYKDKNTGQRVEQTEWVRVSAFGNLAEIMGKFLKKGSKIFVSGKMKTDSYEKEGVKMYATKVVANEMYMLDGKPDSGSETGNTNQASNGPSQQQAPQDDDFDSDIPF